jgi:hypothetical protein
LLKGLFTFPLFSSILKLNYYGFIIIYLFEKISYNLLFKRIYGEKWGLGIGDWGLGIGDWAQSPIPNPQSPIPIYVC